MWVAAAYGAATAVAVAEQQQMAARKIAQYEARMQERTAFGEGAHFPSATCDYCGSVHYEQRCPSCGAPRRKT